MTSGNKIPSHHGINEATNKDYPNQTLRLLCERASLRNFSDRKIEPELLDQIFEAGIHSATGGNLQPYSIIKIEDERTRSRFAVMCGQKFMGNAPVHLLFCIDLHRLERWARLEIAPFSADRSFRHFWISFQDTIICAQNICTAIDSLGLGSVYIGTIIEHLPEIREMLELPKGVLPVVLLCLGYPKTDPKPKKKLGADVVVHSEKYRELDDSDLIDAYSMKYENQRIMITDERMKVIEDVCRLVDGDDFAEQCLENIREKGYISMVQRYFGLHYRADLMPKRNEIFLKTVEEFGFGWFK